MSSDWPSPTVEDSMLAIIDYRGRSPKKAAVGVPLITAKVVKGGRILPATEFIAAFDYDKWMRRGLPEENDLLMTTEAPLGEVALVEDPRIALAQRLILLRPKPDVFDKRYLKYAFLSSAVQDQLRSRATGTTVMGIRQSELRRVEIPCPPLAEQQAIAEVLGALDDKIALNRRVNRTLEEMAAALFRSWFVDFDPVVARADGRAPFGMDAETAALFPDAFVDSEEGPIPEGWLVQPIGNVVNRWRRSADPDAIADDTPYIGLEHMPRRHIALTEWGVAGAVGSTKSRFREGDILFGKLRPYFGKVGIAFTDGICSTDILVLRAIRAEFQEWALGHLSGESVIGYAAATASGTRMPRTKWSILERYPVAVPPLAVARVFAEQVRPYHSQMRVGASQSRTLAALRDTLLPQLLSGTIRLRDAERQVGEA